MGLFQQQPDDEENQGVLPTEPFERGEAEALETAPVVDSLALGLGFGATSAVSSIVFPAAPTNPDAIEPEADEHEELEHEADEHG